MSSYLPSRAYVARDKLFDRAIKLEKGKSTHRICEINKRHHAAVEMMGEGGNQSRRVHMECSIFFSRWPDVFHLSSNN